MPNTKNFLSGIRDFTDQFFAQLAQRDTGWWYLIVVGIFVGILGHGFDLLLVIVAIIVFLSLLDAIDFFDDQRHPDSQSDATQD